MWRVRGLGKCVISWVYCPHCVTDSIYNTIVQKYRALIMTPNMDCYKVGAVPKLVYVVL